MTILPVVAMRTDRRTDTTKLNSRFLNFVNALKKTRMRYNGYTVPLLPLLCTVRNDFQTQSMQIPNQDIQHIRCCSVMNTLRLVTSANDVTVTLATPHSLTVQEGGVPS